MKPRPLALIFVLLLALTSCTAGPNTAEDVPDAEGDVAGCVLGLWHGMISPVTFFVSLFTDSVSLYEVHNSGGWYDLGFVLGAGIILGSSGSSASSERKKK